MPCAPVLLCTSWPLVTRDERRIAPNKPNFPASQMTVSPVMTRPYDQIAMTSPNNKQTQSNPISSIAADSILSNLCRPSRPVIIEDVDLMQKELIQHLAEYDLENIVASRINKYSRVNSASIFCLYDDEFADLLPGKRIW
jgi:hypothetical protein